MWQQTAFPVNEDSDKSISDEEDVDFALLMNRSSFVESNRNKDGLGIQSQLELLRGTQEPSYGGKCGSSVYEAYKEDDFSLDDDVELPDFQNEDGLICSDVRASTSNYDEEIISDDEAPTTNFIPRPENFLRISHHNFQIGKQDGEGVFSAASKDASALLSLNKNASKKIFRGVKGKGKRTFSFRAHPHARLSGPPVSDNDINASSLLHEIPKRLEVMEDIVTEHTSVEHLEDVQGGMENRSKIVDSETERFKCESNEHSMAGILDGLQDRTHLQREYSETHGRTRGKRIQLVTKRRTSKLGDRVIDNEAIGSGSSSENEEAYENLKLDASEIKRQTMADQFHEILGAISASSEGSLFAGNRPGSNGLFGKLQEVMQSEKEREMDFLKMSQTLAHPNNKSGCIHVKILSRSFDAKLTVCGCSQDEKLESVRSLESTQTTFGNGMANRTIIFNPRVCSDVELEVGNVIRVHPPWKEMQVKGKNEVIILSMYFSQM